MNEQDRIKARYTAMLDQADAASANDDVKVTVSATDLARLLSAAEIGSLEVLIGLGRLETSQREILMRRQGQQIKRYFEDVAHGKFENLPIVGMVNELLFRRMYELLEKAAPERCQNKGEPS